jgi:hypothetical protein
MASLTAAKRRRAPGAPSNMPAPERPNLIVSNTATQPSGQLTLQQAISLVGSRITKVENTLNTNMKEVENKFGQQDNYIVENLPDIDAINIAFEDINKRLLNVESGIGTDSRSGSESDLTSIKETLNGHEEIIKNMQTSYNEKLDFIENSVSALDNTTKVVFMESNLNKLVSEVSDLKIALEVNPNEEIQDKILTIENRLNDIAVSEGKSENNNGDELANITNHIDKAIEQINNRLNQLESNIESNETLNIRLGAIENSETNQLTIESINSRIDALEVADSS